MSKAAYIAAAALCLLGVLLHIALGPDTSAGELPGNSAGIPARAAPVLPAAFDWRDVGGGKSLVTADWNQNVPEPCQSGWVHAAASALNDRIKIARAGAFPDVMISRQALLNCIYPAPGGEVDGPGRVYEYLLSGPGVPDDSCISWEARPRGCGRDQVCRNCWPGTRGCFVVQGWVSHGASAIGKVSGEEAMMREIYARGPIACTYRADAGFRLNYTANAVSNGGVYVALPGVSVAGGADTAPHAMEVAGWGEAQDGRRYWVVRNSFGTYWGAAGWAKLERGVNLFGGEAGCDWATPRLDKLEEAVSGGIAGDYVLGARPASPRVPGTVPRSSDPLVPAHVRAAVEALPRLAATFFVGSAVTAAGLLVLRPNSPASAHRAGEDAGREAAPCFAGAPKHHALPSGFVGGVRTVTATPSGEA